MSNRTSKKTACSGLLRLFRSAAHDDLVLLDFKVLEFSKDDRRIVLSHKATWSAEEDKSIAAAKKKAPSKSKAIENINQQTEKSTLGDIEALSALKEKMSGPQDEGEGKAQ